MFEGKWISLAVVAIAIIAEIQLFFFRLIIV
jgi:hypothetical protein